MYRSYWIHRAGVVAWQRATELRDVVAMRRELREHRAAAGAPLTLVMIFPPGFPYPTEPVREALKSYAPSALKLCASVFNVIEGSDVGASLFASANRSLLTTMGFANLVQTCDSLDEALELLPLETRAAKTGLRRWLQREHLLAIS